MRQTTKRCENCGQLRCELSRPRYGVARRYCSWACQERHEEALADSIAGVGLGKVLGLVDIGRKRSAALTTPPTASELEESYPSVAQWGDVRVIRCRDDIQWIVQRYSGGRWSPITGSGYRCFGNS
jgi:hypothetical protein